MMSCQKPNRLPKPAVKVMPDGREICDCSTPSGRAEYKRRSEAMAERQHYRCALCGKTLVGWHPSFDHEDGRGMGGGRRDDRIWVDGKWKNAAVHISCNNDKGSRRVPYVISQPPKS
jgi:hypothetical protein